MKNKSETILKVSRGLVLDFGFYLFLLYDKVTITCNFSTWYNIGSIMHHLMSYVTLITSCDLQRMI